MNIFTIKNDDLNRLSPDDAEDFFRELIWTEARKIGLPISKIHISSKTTTADGGIDAYIEDNDILTTDDLIKQGHTGYQIKAGTSFKPWRDSSVKDELFGGREPVEKNLKSKIKDCLDKDGTYVVVCFKQDPQAQEHDKAVELIYNYLKQCNYDNPKVEVWGQNKLIGFIKPYISLALHLKRFNNIGWFKTHHQWSTQGDMKKEFKIGDEQEKFIKNIRNDLRNNEEAVHIRVLGEAGIGKTRLVLEATREEDLAPLILYTDNPDKFKNSVLMEEFIRQENHFCVILVIDECTRMDSSYIWNQLEHYGSRIKIITINNEFEEASSNIRYFNVPPLKKEQVISIVKSYDVPEDTAVRFSDLCSGSPRVAHVIGWNLINYPEDLLRDSSAVNIWDRYIAGGEDPKNQEVSKRRLVLSYIALFKKFGYRGPVVNEAKSISNIIKGYAEPNLTWIKFQEIVNYLKKSRRILQGEHTLYITPKALHIKMWRDWWDQYGNGFDLDEFVGELTPKLQEWYFEMFKYAQESPVAKRVVQNILGEDGPFKNSNYLETRVGGNFFNALSEAAPNSSLSFLKDYLGNKSEEELYNFTTGRRQVIFALEKIVVWKELFFDAAKLLLRLAESENEPYSNNATGIFIDLFSPGPGKVAPTEVAPLDRIPIIKEALKSNSKKRKIIALKACNQALESNHFMRMSVSKYQGLNKEPDLWTPNDKEEIYTYYRKIWNVVYNKLKMLNKEEREIAVDFLLQRARELTRIDSLSDLLLESTNNISQMEDVNKRDIFETINDILKYDKDILSDKVIEKWQSIKNSLFGKDYHSSMERYVGMYLLENDEKYLKLQIRDLAMEAFQNRQLLRQELKWLIIEKPDNSYLYGYELGQIDKNLSLLDLLINAQQKYQKDIEAKFLGGYFRAIFENDSEQWDEKLDFLCEDSELVKIVPELTWRSGITDRAALRLLKLAEKGIMNINIFKMFNYGRKVHYLSKDIFNKWIVFLINSSNPDAASISINVYYSFYLHNEKANKLPNELTLKVLLNDSFFKTSDRSYGQMDCYYWNELGEAFIDKYPEDGLKIAEKILEKCNKKGSIIESYQYSSPKILNKMFKLFPDRIWGMISKRLGPPIDEKAFYIKGWLRGGMIRETEESILYEIPQELIWDWVDEDIDNRAWYLATFIPKELFHDRDKVCLARQLLVRYGDREKVRINLVSNFMTEIYWGPTSSHYNKKMKELISIRDNENDENVIRWLNDFIDRLQNEIEKAKIQEEREF